MIKLLNLLHGKKATIVAIIGLIILYLSAENIINDNMAYLLDGILTILAGGANIATNKLITKKN